MFQGTYSQSFDGTPGQSLIIWTVLENGGSRAHYISASLHLWGPFAFLWEKMGYLFQVGIVKRSDFPKVHCLVVLGLIRSFIHPSSSFGGTCLKPSPVLGAGDTQVNKRILPLQECLGLINITGAL